jgi:hypothetical protein
MLTCWCSDGDDLDDFADNDDEDDDDEDGLSAEDDDDDVAGTRTSGATGNPCSHWPSSHWRDSSPDPMVIEDSDGGDKKRTRTVCDGDGGMA